MSGEAFRAQGRAVTLALVLILCLNQPRAEQNADFERAGKLFDEKKYEEALGLYSRVIQAHPDTPEARKADVEAARCLDKLDRTNEAIARLEQAIQKYAGKPERASALLALARVYGPRRALKVYETLISDHPDTPEASEGQLGKARCLRDLGREPESLVIYEEIVRKQAGTEYAARALLLLGLYYEQREDRTRARSYYQKIVDEYPEDWRWTRWARSSLESLDRYFFSPLYDKLMFRIKHHLLSGVFHLDRSSWPSFRLAGVLALGLTSYTVELGALALALGLLWLCRRVVPGTPGEGILRRKWSVRGIVVLLVGLWTFTLLAQVGTYWLLPPEAVSAWFLLHADRLFSLLVDVAMIAAVLWGESPRRVLAVPWRLAWRVARVSLASSVVLLLMMVVVRLIHDWLVGLGVETVRLWNTGLLDPSTPWLKAVAYYLIGALAEECVYRGAVYQAFRARTGPWIAGPITALLFAQMHVHPLGPTISHFAVGVVLARVVERTRSLTPATLLHGLYNLFLFALSR